VKEPELKENKPLMQSRLGQLLSLRLERRFEKVIIQQMLQLSSANVFVQVARFIKNLAFARILGPNLFGLWNGLQVILVYGANAHLGALQAMNREIPLNRGRGALQLIPHIVRVSLSFTLLSTSLIAAILFAIGATLEPSKIEATALKLIAAVLAAQQLFQFFHFLLRAEDDFGRLSLVLIIQTILELVVSVGFIYWIGFNGIFYGFLISFILATLICLKWKYQLIRGLELDFKLAGNLIRIGFPIMLVGLSYNLLTTLDRVMIIKFFGSEQLGYYSLGPLALIAIAYVPTTINQVMYPKFGERYGTTGDPRSLASFVRVPTLITAHLMGLVLGVAFLIIPLAALFLGNYAPGIPAARILFAGFYFISLVGPAANLLITIDRQMQYLFWLVGVAILVTALDGVAIIANLGIEGIAAATGISYAVYAFG
jgi:O-antigen/teichoic acid export membrane protein